MTLTIFIENTAVSIALEDRTYKNCAASPVKKVAMTMDANIAESRRLMPFGRFFIKTPKRNNIAIAAMAHAMPRKVLVKLRITFMFIIILLPIRVRIYTQYLVSFYHVRTIVSTE